MTARASLLLRWPCQRGPDRTRAWHPAQPSAPPRRSGEQRTSELGGTETNVVRAAWPVSQYMRRARPSWPRANAFFHRRSMLQSASARHVHQRPGPRAAEAPPPPAESSQCTHATGSLSILPGFRIATRSSLGGGHSPAIQIQPRYITTTSNANPARRHHTIAC
ncbi:hypothetical protein GQ53DRAFT_759204 [Thozetella sp. PMI_491]|nr:hypothetical protein GQ53DRAFT_759204 [Thozetella sp. PMI_491]